MTEEDDELDPGGPERTAFRSLEEFEAKLLEGLNSPASEMTDADWDELRQRLLSRNGIEETPGT